MDIEEIRPIVSGLIGGILATWIATRWANKIPSSFNFKSKEELIKLHRVSTYVANTLFVGGLFFGVFLYSAGDFPNSDARPFFWGYGLASTLPLISIYFVSALQGKKAKEAYVAFAWAQNTPVWVVYSIMGAGAVAFLFLVMAHL